MRTLLLYNPVSGRKRAKRGQTVGAIADMLRGEGHEVRIEATTGRGSAAEQARTAVADGTELVIACGGDGTLHDTLQGIVEPENSEPRVILGVIPMGSGNALARHLGLSTDPLAAARQLLAFRPRVVPVGRIETANGGRYFTVMAGAGPSAVLVYPGALGGGRFLSEAKQRLGRIAYYVYAAVLVAIHPFPAFELRWTDPASGAIRTARAVAAIAVRIESLGGLFHPLAPPAQVHHPHLTLVAVRPPGRLGLPAWVTASWLRQRRRIPLVLEAEASEFWIVPLDESRVVHLQADGEWIGVGPAHACLLPNALRLLMPAEL